MFGGEKVLDKIRNIGSPSMVEHLGIRFTDVGDDYITATMPVDHRTTQPFGILHGGASVVLAETLGSVASTLLIDAGKQSAVGVEVNANHLRPVRSGQMVTGKVNAIHVGRKMHVWEIAITNEEEKLVCISRLTVSILDK